MTAAELIAKLQELPPATPVVVSRSLSYSRSLSHPPWQYSAPDLDTRMMYRTVSGTYSAFLGAENQHRNDTQVLVIG